MNSAELARAAVEGGQALSSDEANVVIAPGMSAPGRAWVGQTGLGHAAVYLEVSSADSMSFVVSQVIEVTTVRPRIAGTDYDANTVKLVCTQSSLDGVFWTLVDDVLDRMRAGTSAVEALRSAVSEWRDLILRAARPLSASVALGLFAELSFLNEAYKEIGSAALRSWQVDPHSPQDFIGSTSRVEVKGSTFQDRSSIVIHGLRQLQVPSHSTLTLGVAEVEKHGDGHTLDYVVNSLLDSGAPRSELLEKLRTTGFVLGASTNAEHRFELRGWRFWEIDEDSPVLTAAILTDDVATAIESVEYRLTLSALGEFDATFDWHRLDAPFGGDIDD